MNDFGDTRLKRSPLKRRRLDFEMKKQNAFRGAELRLKKKIFVAREKVEKEEDKIPNPVALTEAFSREFLSNIFEQGIFCATPFQSQAWPVILGKMDMIGIVENDEDRMWGFILPVLAYLAEYRKSFSGCPGPTVVCLSPTPLEIVNKINKFNFKCLNIQDDKSEIKTWNEERYEVIATTPKCLCDQIRADKVTLSSVSYVVLEKADNLPESEIESIFSRIPEDRQTIVTNATWSDNVHKLATTYCTNPVKVTVSSKDLTECITVTQQAVVVKKEHKITELVNHLPKDDKVVLFCNEQFTVNYIYATLLDQEVECNIFHHGQEKLEELNTDAVKILITNVATRDLKMAGVRCIYNYDFPEIKEYIDRICEAKKVGSNVISLLSEDDWPIVPDLVAVLREMNQVIPPELFDLANQFKTVKFIEKAQFVDIVKTEYFVDKSLLIKTIIETCDNYLICAPRKFGKSTNLDMLLQFFNYATAVQNQDIFQKLKISKHPDIMDHYGQYAVLKVDMSNFLTSIFCVHTCKLALREIIRDTYLRYNDLFKSLDEKHICKRWCGEELYLKIEEKEIYRAFYILAEFLNLCYEKPVILICDEFDSICNNVLWKKIFVNGNDDDVHSNEDSCDICKKSSSSKIDEGTLDEIIKTYFDVFKGVIKTDLRKETEPKNPVAKEKEDEVKTGKEKEDKSIIRIAIFSGVTPITCTGLSALNNLPSYKFLENSEFKDFYGIKISEFEDLLRKPMFEKLREEKDRAVALYNGYQSVDKCAILGTYSVIKYLSSVAKPPKERLKHHWSETGSASEFIGVLERENMRNYLQQIILGTAICVKEYKSIVVKDLFRMKDICKKDCIVLSNMDILFIYLQQLGYLSGEISDGRVLLKVPNEEIRQVFVDALTKSIQFTFHLSDTNSMDKCAKCFNQLIVTNNTEDIMKEIEEELSKICRGCPRDGDGCLHFNESTLESLLFSILITAQFQVISQTKVQRDSIISRSNWKILDLCFYKWNFGILVELKYGKLENERDALLQIKNKGYANVLNNNQISMPINKVLLIGIHINEEGKATLAYTDDIQNYVNMV